MGGAMSSNFYRLRLTAGCFKHRDYYVVIDDRFITEVDMLGLKAIFKFCLIFWMLSATAGSEYYSLETDGLTVDSQLTLSGLVELTLQNYPDGALIPALKAEADALQRRGNSWVAGSLFVSFYYRNSWLTGANETGAPELEGDIGMPLWNWGQRTAAQNLARQAKAAGNLKIEAMKYQVAGLVRSSLWEIILADIRFQASNRVYDVSERLVATVKKRVDLGDLPRTDLLLAESEMLARRSELLSAESDKIHAEQNFRSLTQMQRVPRQYQEQQSALTEISHDHPALMAVNAEIERFKAELAWVKSEGSGQSIISLGGNSQRGDPNISVETITMEVVVPFGGEAHLAPQIAATNLELSNTLVEREHLMRQLNKSLIDAKHALEVDRKELEIAKKHREIAETHLKMTRLSFDAGEIDLLDLLKIQSLAHAAINEAEQRVVILQRDIAFYNQVVGQLP